MASQKQKRKVEWIEGWDESKFLLLDPLEWAGFHFVVLDGQISKFSLDATHEPPTGPTQSFEVFLQQNSRFRLTLRPDICPEFSLDGIFTVSKCLPALIPRKGENTTTTLTIVPAQELQACTPAVKKGVVLAKSASGSPLPIQLYLQGSENIVCSPSESKRQYPIEATVPIAGSSGAMSAVNEPVAKSVTLTDIRSLKAHRREPSRFEQDELVEMEFRSEFPNGFELFAQGDDEKVVIFESLATLLGPQNPCEYEISPIGCRN